MDLAEFVALHEARLVDSLAAETGLPRADAAAIARDVVHRAHARGVASSETSPAATYAWLRVAARHRALDELRARQGGPAGTWEHAAAAADQALVRTGAGTLGTLPAEEREVLRLRYVEGLLPAAIAERLGTTTDTVDARLDRARTGAARALRRARVAARRRMALTRVGAPAAGIALAVAVVAALDFTGATVGGQRARGVEAAEPPAAILLAGDDPAARAPHGTVGVGTAALPVAPDHGSVPPVVALPPGDGEAPGGGSGGTRCPKIARTCTDKTITGDAVHVPLPQQARDATGRDDLVVEQRYVPVCSAIPARPPGEVARCVPGRT